MSRRALPFGNVPGAGIAAELLRVKAELAAMTADRDRWRALAERVQAQTDWTTAE